MKTFRLPRYSDLNAQIAVQSGIQRPIFVVSKWLHANIARRLFGLIDVVNQLIGRRALYTLKQRGFVPFESET